MNNRIQIRAWILVVLFLLQTATPLVHAVHIARESCTTCQDSEGIQLTAANPYSHKHHNEANCSICNQLISTRTFFVGDEGNSFEVRWQFSSPLFLAAEFFLTEIHLLSQRTRAPPQFV